MRVLSYNSTLNSADNCNADCEVELTCDCSLEELKQLYSCSAQGITPDLVLNPYQSRFLKELDNKKIEPRFGGMITIQNGEQVYIKRVIYSKPAVIVFWSDGKKTRSTCDKHDRFNGEFGLTLCVLKRFMTSDQLALLLEDWFVEEVNDMEYFDITIKDLRQRNKLLKELQKIS